MDEKRYGDDTQNWSGLTLFGPFFWLRHLPWWVFAFVVLVAIQTELRVYRSSERLEGQIELALQSAPPEPSLFMNFDPDSIDTALQEFALYGFDSVGLIDVSWTTTALVLFTSDQPGFYLVFIEVVTDELEKWMSQIDSQDYVIRGFYPSTTRSIYHRAVVDALKNDGLPAPEQLIFAKAMRPDRRTAILEIAPMQREYSTFTWIVGLLAAVIAAVKFRRREARNTKHW